MLVLVLDFGESNGRAHLSANQLSKPGSALDDAVWNVHLSAQSRQVDDNLDGVDIVGNDDQLSLLLLNKADDLVDARSQAGGSLGWGVWLASCAGLGAGYQTRLLFGLALWGVLLSELEELGGVLLVQGLDGAG